MNTFRRFDARHRRCKFERCEARLALSADSGATATLLGEEGIIRLDVDSAVYFDLSGDRFSADASDQSWSDDGPHFNFWPADADHVTSFDGSVSSNGAGGDTLATGGITTLGTGAVETAAEDFAADIPLRTIATVQAATSVDRGWIALPMIDAHRIEPVGSAPPERQVLAHRSDASGGPADAPAEVLDEQQRPSGQAVFFEVASLDSALPDSGSVKPDQRAAIDTPARSDRGAGELTDASTEDAAVEVAEAAPADVAQRTTAAVPSAGDAPSDLPGERTEQQERSTLPPTGASQPLAVDAAFDEWSAEAPPPSTAPVRWASTQYYSASLALAVAALVAIEQTLASRHLEPDPPTARPATHPAPWA